VETLSDTNRRGGGRIESTVIADGTPFKTRVD
jgi:hypothetical protein